jgi:hypothetical protein
MKKKPKSKAAPNEPVSLDAMSREEEFEWLKDPENRKAYREEAERAARGDYPELPPEARAAARVCLEKLDEQEHLEVVDAKMKQLIKMFKKPGGSMLAEDRLEQCRRLFDELTDELLETREPHRSRILKQILPMREIIHAIKLDRPGV